VNLFLKRKQRFGSFDFDFRFIKRIVATNSLGKGSNP
jgi:hypothetical protein